MTKMTKRDWFQAIAAMVEVSNSPQKKDALAFITHEVEMLDRKSAKTTLTKTQKENIEIKAMLKDLLFEVAEPMTISQIMEREEVKNYPSETKLSSQKVSALIKQMKDAGEVVRTEDKKKAYFSLAE